MSLADLADDEVGPPKPQAPRTISAKAFGWLQFGMTMAILIGHIGGIMLYVATIHRKISPYAFWLMGLYSPLSYHLTRALLRWRAIVVEPSISFCKAGVSPAVRSHEIWTRGDAPKPGKGMDLARTGPTEVVVAETDASLFVVLGGLSVALALVWTTAFLMVLIPAPEAITPGIAGFLVLSVLFLVGGGVAIWCGSRGPLQTRIGPEGLIRITPWSSIATAEVDRAIDSVGVLVADALILSDHQGRPLVRASLIRPDRAALLGIVQAHLPHLQVDPLAD